MIENIILGLAALCGLIGFAGFIQPRWVVPKALPQTATTALGGWIIIGCVVLAIYGGVDSLLERYERWAANQPTTATVEASSNADAESVWISPRYHIYDGVKLYWGAKHRLVGTIIGGNPRVLSPSGRVFAGVKLVRPDGTTVWKDRSAIESGRWWFIKDSDPNKYRGELSTYAY